jgi:beta-lactamase superfamily II metal-dependent hydrolase
MLQYCIGTVANRLAMIDVGCGLTWRPSQFIKQRLGRNKVDYLFITNADQDHMSDLDSLWSEGIEVTTVHSNRSLQSAAYTAIKTSGGHTLSQSARRYASIQDTYTAPVTEPFNDWMGGITAKSFFNPYPTFIDTNNLSLLVFIKFGSFQILFPGDIEEEGWEELLRRPDFRQELALTTVLVASHHGRENGYCTNVFNYCKPKLMVMSDKRIIHDTQDMTDIYRQRVIDHHTDGAYVSTTGTRRHVMTTRSDGTMQFEVCPDGSWRVYTGVIS